MEEMEHRLDRLLTQLPVELRGPYLHMIGRYAALTGMATVRSVLADMNTWIRNLKDLTVLLEKANRETQETMARAIDKAIDTYFKPGEEEEPGDTDKAREDA